MTFETDRFSPTVRQVSQGLTNGVTPQQMLTNLQELARSGQVPLHDVRATEQEVRDSSQLTQAQKDYILQGLDAMRNIIAQGPQNADQGRDMEWLSDMDPFGRAKRDLGIT